MAGGYRLDASARAEFERLTDGPQPDALFFIVAFSPKGADQTDSHRTGKEADAQTVIRGGETRGFPDGANAQPGQRGHAHAVGALPFWRDQRPGTGGDGPALCRGARRR